MTATEAANRLGLMTRNRAIALHGMDGPERLFHVPFVQGLLEVVE